MCGLVVLCWQGHKILLTIAAYCHKCNALFTACHWPKNKTNSVALVRTRTIPTERPPPVGDQLYTNMSLKLSVKQTVKVRGMFIGILCLVCRNAGDKAVCQPEGPATGHLDTAENCPVFLCVIRQALRWFRVAKACLSCSPSYFDLSKLIPLHQRKL